MGTAIVGKVKKTVGPGDMIYIPMATVHAFTAKGEPFKMVAVESPPIMPTDMHMAH